MQLNLMLLKYKAKVSLDSGDIDWRKICEEDKQPKLYNKYLLELTSRDMTYGYGASLGGTLCDTHNPTLGLFSRTFLHTMSS